MALVGHSPRQAPQRVQRESITDGILLSVASGGARA